MASPQSKTGAQVRGGILLLGRAFDLMSISVQTAGSALPEIFDDLPKDMQISLVSSECYLAARREVLRLLVHYGASQYPWEVICAIVRKTGRNDIEKSLYHLRAPAKDVGLSPADITTAWFNTLDRAAGVGIKRMSLRAGATAFNKLFEMPEVAGRKILPVKRIGPFLKYDKLGQPLGSLPPRLEAIWRTSKDKGAIAKVWHAICVSGKVSLPADPGPEDLLGEEVWGRVLGLSGGAIGLSAASFHVYKLAARRALERALHGEGSGAECSWAEVPGAGLGGPS